MSGETYDGIPPAVHAATNDSGTLRVVMERLGSFSAALAEIKGIMISLDRRQQQAELDRVGTTALLDAKITSAHTRLDAHNEKLLEHRADIDAQAKAQAAAQRETDRQLGQFATAYRIMAFVGSALALSVIALIWGLLTGQVHLTFGS